MAVRFIVFLALLVGIMLALSAGALARKMLISARKHENTALVYLHVFWIVTIVTFATQLPLLLR